MATGTIPATIGKLFIPYGTAYTLGKTITIPGTSNNYLLFTTNNNTNAVTLWFIRPDSTTAIQLFGGSAVSVTIGSNRAVTVTPTGYNVGVFVAEIG